MISNFRAIVAFMAIMLLSVLSARGAEVPSDKPQIQSANLRIEFDRNLRSRVVARFEGKDTTMGPFTASESVTGADKKWTDFSLTSEKSEPVTDAFGTGHRLILAGKSGTLNKAVTVTMYDDFPTMAFFDVQYTNTGKSKLAIKGWTNNSYSLDAQGARPHDGGKGTSRNAPPFWSYESGSYESRPNWVLPLHASFKQENFLGMNASDYGGGTPIVDVWRRDVGVAVGHVETRPKLVSLPVSMPDSAHATIGVKSQARNLARTRRTFSQFPHIRHRSPGRLLSNSD